MACPICALPECPARGYPHMWAEYAAGRNRQHWRRKHDFLNAPPESDVERAARLLAEHPPDPSRINAPPCGGCGGPR